VWAKYFIQWLCGLALWFLFVYQFSKAELLAGALSSALAVLSLNVSLRAVPLNFSPKAAWFLPLLMLPLAVLEDLVVLIRAAARTLSGKPVHSGFQRATLQGIAAGRHASAKRALAVAITSVAPNSIVVDVEPKRRLIVFHQMEKTALPDTLEELEHSR
jgi:multisubunit Na+/H+ antiporter MnhE subunit